MFIRNIHTHTYIYVDIYIYIYGILGSGDIPIRSHGVASFAAKASGARCLGLPIQTHGMQVLEL